MYRNNTNIVVRVATIAGPSTNTKGKGKEQSSLSDTQGQTNTPGLGAKATKSTKVIKNSKASVAVAKKQQRALKKQ
jgi:hypothetical protein